MAADREQTLRLASDLVETERMPDRLDEAKTIVKPGTTLASADTIAHDGKPTTDPGRVRDIEAELASHDPGRRYEQTSLLGEGGMGEVRLCRDKHIVRDVAMKVMRPSSEQHHELRARFLREARVQGQLEHPAIVPVYDLGRDGQGNAYFTMRRIRGETLETIIDKVKRGAADEDGDYARHKLLSVFQRVCLAVDYAHKKGVIHRDLKPGNIMIGSYGEVYVLDWGLAKIMTPDEQAIADGAEPVNVSSSGISVTEVGQVMGTPGYMAPEQILGQTAEIGARADIYALGAILFELLTLQSLCGAGTATEILMRAVKGVNARGSERAPERDVPPELDDVCMRATMAAARDRYASAREIHDAVDRYVSGDRDMARRRELADEHTTRAREAGKRALEKDSEEDRKSALFDLGRALALDPANGQALGTLVEILTEPPKEMPREVIERIEESERASRRKAMLVGALCFFFGSFLTWGPFALAMGVTNWTCAILIDAAWTIVALAAYYYYRHPADTHTPVIAILSAVATGFTAMVCGPLLVLPSIAIATTVSFVVSGQKEHRWFAVACGLLSIVVPYGLELAGVLPPSLRVHDGIVEIVPRAFAFHPMWTPLFFLVSQSSLVVVASVFVARYRDAFVSAERRVHLQAWQLRQLVPDVAKGAFDSVAPAPAEMCKRVDLVQRISKKSA